MKVLLDEHLAPDIAEQLRQRQLDALAMAEEPDLLGASDARILAFASAQGRAVVTANIKDFRPLAAARLATGGHHSGLILVPARRSRSRAAIPTLVDGIAAVMQANPDGLADSERWLPATALTAQGISE